MGAIVVETWDRKTERWKRHSILLESLHDGEDVEKMAQGLVERIEGRDLKAEARWRWLSTDR